MSYAALPFAAIPLRALPGWALPGRGGYRVYIGLGSTPADVDYDSPAGFAQAGQAVARIYGYSFAPDARYVVALRAVSDAGVEEANTSCWTTLTISDADELAGPAPNAPQAVEASAAPGGYVDVHAIYSRLDECGSAANLQVAALDGDDADWGEILGTAAVATAQMTDATIRVGPLDEGVAVMLAVRAITGDSVTGPVAWCLPVAPDATGPAAVSSLAAEGL